MSANMMYSPLESVFEATMEREGQILSTYSSRTEFKAFFRIRNDNENQRETIVIYYDITAPVHSGTLVMIGNGVYLALNKETVENDVYYKSTLIKCNGIYNSNDGVINNIPFYSDNMKSSVSIENTTISMIKGNVELLTEENSLSKKVNIDTTFNEFDRTFKVTNKYTIDGITHIIAEVDTNKIPTFTYSVRVEGIPTTNVKQNSVIQLTAVPYVNDHLTTGATFNWTSSDQNIATVDDTGKVTCLSDGTVIITVTWIEKDIIEKIEITVVNEEVPVTPTYKFSISGKAEMKCGISRTYTFKVTDDSGSAVEFEGFLWKVIADFTVSQTINGNKIELCVDDEDAIDKMLLLQAVVDGEVKAELPIRITSMV